jgi:hypothetical protein
MSELERVCGGKRLLSECKKGGGGPDRGVYFFFEEGELREDAVSPRVVRVGTHGLRPSKSTLWGRLAQHKGNVGGSRPNGGNHRGSVFRLHVGPALLGSGNWPDAIGCSWAVGATAAKEVRNAEYPLERAVSQRIGSMPFLWVCVDDEPSQLSERGVIERGAIATLSNLNRDPIDSPSVGWLGKSSARARIRESGLWNVNHVDEIVDSSWLEVLATRIGNRNR